MQNLFCEAWNAKFGPTGRGWEERHFGAYLTEFERGDVKINWTTNRYNFFQKNEQGGYQPRHIKCHFDRLVKNADGSFTLTRHSGRIYQFNAQGGRLLEISNKKGQSLGRDAMPRVSTSVICFDARHLETRGIASLHRIIENCGKGCPFISRKVAKPLSF